MNKLQSVIKKYASQAPVKKMGATQEGLGLTQDQTDRLATDLNAVSVRNGKIFWMIFGVILAVFVLSVVFVALNQDNPDKIKLIFGITGISVMGLIYYMVKIWKEKNYIDITLILVRTLDKEMVNSILKVLLDKLG